MWSRRAFLLFSGASLGACGFQPVFRTGGAGNRLRGSIVVETPETVPGFQLGTALIRAFGSANSPRYVLRVELSETQSAAAVTFEGDTSRFDLTGVAAWSLVTLGNEAVVASGTSQTFTSYSATGSTVATQTAKRDARERLSNALADLIVADVALAAP